MDDERLTRLRAALARFDGPATWLARLATVAAVAAVPPGLALWWAVAGDDLADRWRGTAGAVVVLVVCLLPAAWLVNVRLALTSLVDLPAQLGEVGRRRAGELRRRRVERPRDGVRGTAGAIRTAVRDYRSVAGGWGLVVQLVSPVFWLLTLVALAAVPVLWLVAPVALLLG